MRILEELGTFTMSVTLALAIFGVAAVMLHYFNSQQPVDYAKAAFYPLVKPLNATHVWLGVKPSADKVEVVELKYQYGGRWVDVPVARLIAERAVWLNATDGRPVAVPCFANVTVATRYGTASRAASFTPVCLQRQAQIVDDLAVLLQQMVSYGSYVLDYVAYKSTPVLTAYFDVGPLYVTYRYDEAAAPRMVEHGSLYIGFQNVAPFPYTAVHGTPADSADWPGVWPPDFQAVSLAPGEHRNIENIPSGPPFLFAKKVCPDVNEDYCQSFGGWVHTCPNGACGAMYRWLNVYVYWNDTLEIWINNMRAYNGTPPANATEFKTPQGFAVVFDPDASRLEIRYLSFRIHCYDGFNLCENFGWMYRSALNLSVSRGATQWIGWVRMINVPGPTENVTITQLWNVMPAGPYVGRIDNFELFGVVPPFEVYSVYAAVNGSGLVVRVGDPNCGMSERCIRTLLITEPGTHLIDTGVRAPAGLPVYFDDNYLIAVVNAFSERFCDGRTGDLWLECATINWYVPNVSAIVINENRKPYGEPGTNVCLIQTDSRYPYTVAFREQTWQIECGTWWEGYTPCNVPNCFPVPTGWTSFGVIKLVFHRNYTISVYKDGQYLYKVQVYTCRVPGAGLKCWWGPWPASMRLIVPLRWGPDGVTIHHVRFVPIKYNILGTESFVSTKGTLSASLPFYYKYNVTGAYPYRLEVKINTTEKEIGKAGRWIYINVTYSGYLKLYLGDRLVAYDAIYGWTIRRTEAPPPLASIALLLSQPSEVCVPQVTLTPKGLVHKNFQQGQDGYSVEVLRRYEVREFGCGVDRTYTTTTSARVTTVTGTSYHVKDPKNNVCGFREARNCGGVVYCDRCPGK